ncbi:MAG TPA: hypothetical protein VN704_00510 [Verrucomicrobiae bacterium]|nr:hypothetical protein [Verrucomicrobiae bacterium]
MFKNVKTYKYVISFGYVERIHKLWIKYIVIIFAISFLLLSVLSFFSISFAQQLINNTSFKNNQNLTSFINKIQFNHSSSNNSFFSFFFEASGGLIQLNNNVFYNSNQAEYLGRGGFIHQIISINNEINHPVYNITFMNNININKIKDLAIDSKFFDSKTFLSKGSSELRYSLYIAIDNKTNTIVWNNNKDIPNNLKELVNFFRITCNNYC